MKATMFFTVLAFAGAAGAAAMGPLRLPAPPPLPLLQHPPLLVVARTSQQLSTTADPLWEVRLVVDGQIAGTLPALIGRADRQSLDRHKAGTKAPLPVGRYEIIRSQISGPPFTERELGKGYWIPIEPLFRTGRSYLGIHHDPSWGQRNGESGTSGCIGLQAAGDTYLLSDWIRKFDIKEIRVDS